MKNKNKEIKWLLDEKYGGAMSDLARKDIKRLEKGEPVDYIIGFVNFLGCKIDLSLMPFIPEPETEHWVGEAIKEIGILSPEPRILDIFSGSGCIGTAILKNVSGVKVDFAEKENKFLKQIKINLEINNINKERFSVIKSDVFQNIKGKYDFILANPPYIALSRKNKVQKSVLKYEPKIALFGGKDGLFIIKKFLKEVRNHLNENGKVYMEFDSFQKNQLEKVLKSFGYKNFVFEKDQYGKWRYIVFQNYMV